MIHDFAVTDQDVVFWQAPVMFSLEPELLESGFPFVWDEAGPSRVGIMPLGGPASEIRWVEVDPFMAFHGLNAHRDGDEVVIQVHKQTSAFGPDGYLLPSYLFEWRVDTSGPELSVTETQVSDVYQDMPAIDRRLTGRPVGHAWCTTVDGDGPWGFEFAGLNHLDLRSGEDDRWEPGEMERAGEAFYVPDGDTAAEGEGWVLSWLYDRTVDRSSLGVFDAMDIAAGPVARVHLPTRVPYGFHGLWIPDAV
jgi:carotenoid cleavage dioxygenase